MKKTTGLLLILMILLNSTSGCAFNTAGPTACLTSAVPKGTQARLGVDKIHELAFSPDGEMVAVATDTGTYVCRADLSEQAWASAAGAGAISVAWSPDGATLASGSMDGTIILWDTATGKRLRTIEGHTDWVRSVVWSPDGKMLATESLDAITLWNAATGKRLHTLEGLAYTVRSVAWSPDGATLATEGRSLNHQTRNIINLWDVGTGTPLQTFDGVQVVGVAWSPDGKMLATGGVGFVTLLDALTGERLRTLEGHSYPVSSVAWSPDGATLASVSGDNTVALWDAATGEQLRTIEGQGKIEGVAWSPNGTTLAFWSEDGIITLWNTATGETIVHSLEPQ